MKLTVEPEVFEAFPGMRLVIAVAYGVDNTKDRPGIREEWQRAWTSAAEERVHGKSRSHPRIRPWREAWQRLGVSSKKFPSSIEAMLRRAMKGGEPFSINPLVDFYNAISLKHIVPAGGFDLSETGEELVLRFTKEGDTFQALDEKVPMEVPVGEVAYATDSAVLTRHFVWRQARRALITPETRNVFLVSEILAEIPAGVAALVESDLREGLRSFFEVDSHSFCVDSAKSTVSW